MAVILFNHLRQKRFSCPKMRDRVHFKCFLHHRVVCFKKTLASNNSSIIDQNRDVSSELGSFLCNFVDFSAVAYIAFEGVCFSAVFSRTIFIKFWWVSNLISSTVSSFPLILTSRATITHPLSASFFAISAPIPFPAPVMQTISPFKSNF